MHDINPFMSGLNCICIFIKIFTR